MKPKNVMLLGFVNRAVKYLDDHLNDRNDPKLREIKDIDFKSLREQLRQDLDISLGTMQSTVKTLLQAGEEAFDDFMGLHLEENTLADELDDIFTGKEEKPVSSAEDLSELLSFYNLGNLELNEEEKTEDLKEEVPQGPVEEISAQPLEEPEETTDDVSEFFFPEEENKNEETEETVNETENPEEEIPTEEEKTPVKIEYPNIGLNWRAPESKEESLPNTEEEIPTDTEKTDVPEETETAPEETAEDDTTPIPQEKESEEENIFLMTDEDNELLRQIAENVNQSEEIPEQPEPKEEIQNLDTIFSEVLAHEEEEQPEVEDVPEIPVIDENDLVRLAQDIDEKHNLYYADLPEDTDEEEPETEPLPEEIYENETEEELPEEPEPENEEVYVSSLIEELKQRMLEEEAQKKAQEEEYRQIYDRIHRIYPNLSNAFIRTVYDLKEAIANEYPLNKEVIVLHRCIFKDVESLRQFVEIALNHNFSINADEDKLMVDAIKEYVNADGRIITSIFEVANQSAQLGGEYDGYRVMLEETV